MQQSRLRLQLLSLAQSWPLPSSTILKVCVFLM
jgi:hypothetical protein